MKLAPARVRLLPLVLAGLAIAAPVGAQLAAGDLVVSDFTNARVLRVQSDGTVTTLSPPPGPGANLLEGPAGIVVTPDRKVVVVDNPTGRLVEIDPASGAQRMLPMLQVRGDGGFGVGSLGASPWGVHLDAFGLLWITSTAGDNVSVYGLATGVVATAFGTSQVPELGGTDGPYGIFVLGYGSSWDALVADGTGGLVSYRSDGTPPAILAPHYANGIIWGVVIPPSASILGPIFTVERSPGGGVYSCANGGVLIIALGASAPFSMGNLLRCPFALTVSRGGVDEFLYVADAGSTIGGSARVVRVATSDGTQTLLASLPDGGGSTLPAGIAYVPEPDVWAADASLLLALALSRRLPRRRTEEAKRCPNAT